MKKIAYRFFSFLLALVFILMSIFHSSNDVSFYVNQYEKNNTEAATGMSLEDLEKTTNVLIDYLNDFSGEKTLYLEVEEFSNKVNVFDERETLHMIDVQILYQNFLIFLGVLLIACTLGFLYLYKKDKSRFFVNFYKGYRFSLIFTVVTLAILGIVFATNFNWFWVNFHHVFFTNDLWILDASISTMINMFPLEFFYSICVNILIKIISLSFGTYLLAYYFSKKVKNKE